MTEKEVKKLIKKYLNGTITAKEEKLLELFDANLLLRNKKEISELRKHKTSIKRKLSTKNKREHRKPIRNLLKIAASITVIMGLTFFSYKKSDIVKEQPVAELVKTTAWGQKLTVTLPDGTSIKLNSGSVIKFPEKFDERTREVELNGEAFFDVAKDLNKPFIIKSGSLSTKVLGTSFNVNAYPDSERIAVTVASGKVKISSKNRNTILTPNQQGIFHKKLNSITRHEVDIVKILQWKEGIIHFDDITLNKASKILEKWYGVTFVFENEQLGECHITGTYDNEILSAVLESIVYVKKGLQYEFIEDRKILIKGSCND
ncbi:ferric-dicitrate binding protein FerR (iron transport regulator) [Saonia flava]|uniref:Ferric-dicitrate binding protein FerR (Iron transport regulator) n=1 Tax=Saonia flava TaxID=523696 RepID=A0A846QPV0_9FLAO|nr:FecR domain-containing protein [Saonia flava]NJB71076.1 ferric-dicitrate binding protein FerR (iron transport regulator) [Saonia flava]